MPKKTRFYKVENATDAILSQIKDKKIEKQLRNGKVKFGSRIFNGKLEKQIKVHTLWEGGETTIEPLTNFTNQMKLNIYTEYINPIIKDFNKSMVSIKGNIKNVAIIYLRTSSHQSDTSKKKKFNSNINENSLEKQLYRILHSIKQSGEKTMIRFILEHNGVSGDQKNFKRKNFTDIFNPEVLKEYNINKIFIDTPDRLSRDYYSALNFIYMIHNHKILPKNTRNLNLLNPRNHEKHNTVLVTSDGLNSKKDYQQLMIKFKEAQNEILLIKERYSRNHNINNITNMFNILSHNKKPSDSDEESDEDSDGGSDEDSDGGSDEDSDGGSNEDSDRGSNEDSDEDSYMNEESDNDSDQSVSSSDSEYIPFYR